MCVGVCLFLHLCCVGKRTWFGVRQRKAVLEVIMRVNPVTCVQTHWMFLKDNSCLVEHRFHFFSFYWLWCCTLSNCWHLGTWWQTKSDQTSCKQSLNKFNSVSYTTLFEGKTWSKGTVIVQVLCAHNCGKDRTSQSKMNQIVLEIVCVKRTFWIKLLLLLVHPVWIVILLSPLFVLLNKFG